MVTPNADIAPRPDQVSAVHLTKTREQWFTTGSFTTAQGHFGTAGVGNFLSPGIERIDLGLMKNLKISERSTLQLRAEAFNALNHTNFGNPTKYVNGSNAGKITGSNALPGSANGGGRELELGARYTF